MCDRAKCSFCGKAKLGLFMAWAIQRAQTAPALPGKGHVCYGCEDRICNEIAAGRSDIRWLDTISGCEYHRLNSHFGVE